MSAQPVEHIPDTHASHGDKRASASEVAQQLAQIVSALPDDVALEVLHFAEYMALRTKAAEAEPEPTEAELEAEDALWDATTAQYADKLDKLIGKIANAPSLPMFDENGRWLVDDYTEEDFEKAKAKAEAE